MYRPGQNNQTSCDRRSLTEATNAIPSQVPDASTNQEESLSRTVSRVYSRFQQAQNMIQQSYEEIEALGLAKDHIDKAAQGKRLLFLKEAVERIYRGENIQSVMDHIGENFRKERQQYTQVVKEMKTQYEEQELQLLKLKSEFLTYRREAEEDIKQYEDKVQKLQIDIGQIEKECERLQSEMRVSINQFFQKVAAIDGNNQDREFRNVLQIELREFRIIDSMSVGWEQKYNWLQKILNHKVPQYLNLLYFLNSQDAAIICRPTLAYFQAQNYQLYRRIMQVLEASFRGKNMSSLLESSRFYSEIDRQALTKRYDNQLRLSQLAQNRKQQVQRAIYVEPLKHDLTELAISIKKDQSAVVHKVKSDALMFVNDSFLSFAKVTFQINKLQSTSQKLDNNLQTLAQLMRCDLSLQRQANAFLLCGDQSLAILLKALEDLLVRHECDSRKTREVMKENEDHVKSLLRVYQLVFGVVRSMS